MLSIRLTADKGRGVFAERLIQEGELIERAAVIPIPLDEVKHINPTVIYNYWFRWGADGTERAVVLGLGSLYNHSYQPNAYYVRRLEELAIDFIARRKISPGEEICVNYNGRVDDLTPIVFDGPSLSWSE